MSQRRSGRTTRMIEKAKKLAAEGKTVWVIVATARQQADVQKQLGYESDSPRAIVDGTNTLLDWSSGRIIVGTGATVLVDHFAAEQKEQEIEAEIERLYKLRMAVRAIAHEFDECQSRTDQTKSERNGL